MDEQVDVVDQNNKVLYQTSKTIAHEQGLLHRTIIAEVIDSKGKWLFVKQSASRQDAGKLVSPVGGHILAGESEEDALKRETKEELGIESFKYKAVGKCIFDREVLGRRENHYFLVYEIYSDQEPTLNHESEAWEKFSEEEIKKILKNTPRKFGDAFFPIVDKIYPRLKK